MNYTTIEAGALLGLAPKTVTHYCKSGLILAKKVGRDYSITQEQIDTFIATRRSRGRQKRKKI